MNLIEALKKADGKPVARKAWIIGADRTLQLIRDGQRMCWLGGIGDDWREARIGFFTDSALYANDWYVVEPKSAIEEAIEREVDWVFNSARMRVTEIGRAKKAMFRIVNLTLDEAKKVLTADAQHKDYTVVINRRIDALKVKE